MKDTTSLSVAQAYHRAWTSKDFEAAAALLAEDLVVEVPINDYPTKRLFVDAVAGFGSLVTRVALLSEMHVGEEAMQLYDLEVEQLGPLRVVEHFTVRQGRIVRLRHIHDTAALREQR